MIELKRLKLINWHNFENVTFDCARLTYMIGVNAVGKTTILDAIRYCLTTNRNFNALGNKKSGRTLQGSVHAKQRGENAYRRPGRTVAYIGAEFWDSVKRTHFVIAVRVESEGPMQELHPGDQTWYISEDGCTLEQLPFIDPRTGAPSSKENFKPAVGRRSYSRSPGEARDRICRALGIGRAASPLGKKFNEVFQMGTSMDEIPNFREFLYQYILPQPELDLEALQGDRVELENLHAVLAEAQTRAAALEQIVDYGREAAQKETEALVNRGTALLARAEEAAAGTNTWQEHLAAGKRQHEELTARYAAAKDAEAEARRAYLSAHSAAASGEGRALDALSEELARKKTALDKAGRDASRSEAAAGKVQSLLQSLQRSGFAVEKSLWPASLTAETLPQLQSALAGLEKPLEEQYFAARQSADALTAEVQEKQAELASVSGGRWVYPHGDAATRVRDAVNAELKSRGMTPDAKIFCELLSVEDESWQDCVEACLGDRRFDILVPPAHYAAAKSAFVALRDKVGPISLLDTPSIRTANRKADAAPADSLAAQVRSENPLAAQYADTILRRIVCCDTPDTLENYPDSATRDLLRHHPFRLERLRTPQRYIGLDARRARAEALTKALDELTARSKEAAQSAAALKAARDSYQDVLHSSVMDELAALWDARAALEAARADCTAQEQKLAECRENPMLQQLYKEDEAREAAHAIGYPVLVRPSYVLGGRGMEIVYDDAQLRKYVDRALKEAQADTVVSGRLPSPLLIDKFLQDAVEIDVDALFDGEELYIGGIMEHVEEAGVHSGDAACTLPPSTLSDDQIRRLREGTYAIAKGCGVQGLINVQYAFMANTLYVIEANPRASRTVPFASKATGVALAKAAARIMVGETIQQQRDNGLLLPHGDGGDIHRGQQVAVKESVLPFKRFRTPLGKTVDVLLGPEMRSTGEVMGFDRDFPHAFAKSQLAAYEGGLPTSGNVFISVNDTDKRQLPLFAARLVELGFNIWATEGTASVLRRYGIDSKIVDKISVRMDSDPDDPITTYHAEGSVGKNVVQLIEEGAIDLILNTPNSRGSRSDGYAIRSAAIAADLPQFTTMTEFSAVLMAIEAVRNNDYQIMSIQDHSKQLFELESRD